MAEIPLPPSFELEQHHDDRVSTIFIRAVNTGDVVYCCSIHDLSGTGIFYPASPVLPLSPDHRQVLPDLKLRMLEHILHHHQVILLSAGNESTGGRFSWQTQLQHLIGRGYNAYKLAGAQISRFDDKALQIELARPWAERLPLVLVSMHELMLDETYEIPVDYVHSLDKGDARAVLEDRNEL